MRSQHPSRKPPGLLRFAILCSALAALCLMAIMSAAPLEPCVTLRVRPLVMLQRGDIEIDALIPPHPDHKAYVLMWNSDVGVGGRQVRQLDSTSLLLQMQRLRDMPPAHYRFAATIYDAHDHVLGHDAVEIRGPGR